MAPDDETVLEQAVADGHCGSGPVFHAGSRGIACKVAGDDGLVSTPSLSRRRTTAWRTMFDQEDAHW